MAIQTITKDNFDAQVKNQAGPVLLDFWASWCGPCRMMSPILEQFAQLHPELAVGKVNVDEQRELAAAFGIESIPTLCVVQGGKLVAPGGRRADHPPAGKSDEVSIPLRQRFSHRCLFCILPRKSLLKYSSGMKRNMG